MIGGRAGGGSMQRVPVFIRVLLAALGLGFFAGAAKADCVSACQASTYCDSEMNASGECGRRLNECYIDACNRKRYGALAYDAESGAVGWSYDFDDAAGAERKALSGCREQGGNCKIVYDFWNSCAALAAGNDGHYGIGRADAQEQAEADAIADCGQSGGTSCEVQAWSCNSQ
jgi:hypothetical protein